ncbi:transposase [Psychrobacter arenosus]|uniref:transposase n=1 Tax=Psychrobacter arenosus TaxID=256326 RepID=UPI001918B980
MDNASFHKQVQRLLNRHGHRLLFLPPYSSNLSPIEKNRHRQSSYIKAGSRMI